MDKSGSTHTGVGESATQTLPGPAEELATIAVPRARFGYLRRIRTFDSLRFRDYRLLWLGQGGTSMGQWMDQVARTWLIYQLTGSALQLGAVSAMRAMPMLFFGLVAGVVADRYGRKSQLIISQVTNMVLNFVLATLVLTGYIQAWHIYVTAFLAGTVQAFQQPARQALISDLVGQDHLANAVALNSAIFNLMRSVGPAVAGTTIALIGVDGSYYAQAALFAWATVWTMQMNVPGEPGLLGAMGRKLRKVPLAQPVDASKPVLPAGSRQDDSEPPRTTRRRHQENVSFLASIKEGFGYLMDHDLILSLMFLSLVPVLLGMPYASLIPIFALDILDVGSVGQGFLLTSAGVGALIGALTIASLGTFQRKGMLLLAGATMFGLSLVAFSRSTSMPVSMACLFFAGMSNTSYTSQAQTIIQALTPSYIRGRVLSIYMLNRGLMPLGSLLAGALATWFGGPWAVTLMGASCAALAIGIAFRTPRIREIDI